MHGFAYYQNQFSVDTVARPTQLSHEKSDGLRSPEWYPSSLDAVIADVVDTQKQGISIGTYALR